MMHPALIGLPLLMLCTALPADAAEVFKCRQGERFVYQSLPCPPDAQTLKIVPPAAAPDPASVAQARAQAKADIAAAAALRQREAAEEARRRAQAAAAERRAIACLRRLEIIRMLEAPAPGEGQMARKKGQRLALQERKAYIRDCGPLPR